MMGTKRKLPFGYKMESGRVVIDSVDIDPREYETQRLRRLFQKEAPRSELDANLIAMSISAAMVDGNGNVKIRLKNDQIVERGEQNG